MTQTQQFTSVIFSVLFPYVTTNEDIMLATFGLFPKFSLVFYNHSSPILSFGWPAHSIQSSWSKNSVEWSRFVCWLIITSSPAYIWIHAFNNNFYLFILLLKHLTITTIRHIWNIHTNLIPSICIFKFLSTILKKLLTISFICKLLVLDFSILIRKQGSLFIYLDT